MQIARLFNGIIFAVRPFYFLFAIIAALILVVTDPVNALARDPFFRNANYQLHYEECDPSESGSSGSTTSTPLTGSDNEQKVWNFFKSKGFSDEQTAGIMGNLAWESGDPTFNKATSSEELSGGGGFGLAQWTGGRRTEIENAAKSQNRDLMDLQFQLDYLYQEMQTRTERDGGSKTEEQGMKEIQGADALERSTEYFMYNYERPGHLALFQRTALAKTYLNKFGGSGPSGAGTTSISGDCVCNPSSGGGVTSNQSSSNSSENIQKVVDKAVADSTNKGVDLRIVVSGDASASGGTGGQIASASVIKLVVAAALSNNNVPLSSVIGDLTPMIRDSNNDAANRLIDKAGGFNSINAAAHSLGIDANIGRKMLQSPGSADPNRISAQGSDAVLTIIKKSEGGGGKISKEYAGAIMNAMKAQTVSTKWGSSGIPKDKMAHKTGELNGAQHDVGYFFNGDKWLAVSILTNNPSGSPEPGVSIVKDTAKKIYDAWVGNRTENSSGTSSGSGVCNNGSGSSAECGEGGLIGTLKCYAWPEYSQRTDQMPDYTKAVERASSEGRYTGGSGGGVKGNDCGAFVTILLVDSGHEPRYNYDGKGGNTVSQYAWAKENWTTLGQGDEINVADLQPGDVANDEQNHSFMYVGNVDGFGGPQPTGIASASIGGPPRSPMAGQENPTQAKWTWFGKR